VSGQERLRLETDMVLYPDDLLVGAAVNGLIHLEPRQPVTLAIDGNTENPLTPVSAVFATGSMDVSNFCASVYSRDGWSGWNTYENKDCTGEEYEFFAAPHVLRRAILAMRSGIEGSAYRVKSDRFEPYKPIPGQFIATDESVEV
jgi:hypothetical protein